jgi:hypothetical protein
LSVISWGKERSDKKIKKFQRVRCLNTKYMERKPVAGKKNTRHKTISDIVTFIPDPNFPGNKKNKNRFPDLRTEVLEIPRFTPTSTCTGTRFSPFLHYWYYRRQIWIGSVTEHELVRKLTSYFAVDGINSVPSLKNIFPDFNISTRYMIMSHRYGGTAICIFQIL